MGVRSTIFVSPTTINDFIAGSAPRQPRTRVAAKIRTCSRQRRRFSEPTRTCPGQSWPASRTWWRPRKTENCTLPGISPVRGPCSSAAGWAMARPAASAHRSDSSWRPSWNRYVERADQKRRRSVVPVRLRVDRAETRRRARFFRRPPSIATDDSYFAFYWTNGNATFHADHVFATSRGNFADSLSNLDNCHLPRNDSGARSTYGGPAFT